MGAGGEDVDLAAGLGGHHLGEDAGPLDEDGGGRRDRALGGYRRPVDAGVAGKGAGRQLEHRGRPRHVRGDGGAGRRLPGGRLVRAPQEVDVIVVGVRPAGPGVHVARSGLGNDRPAVVAQGVAENDRVPALRYLVAHCRSGFRALLTARSDEQQEGGCHLGSYPKGFRSSQIARQCHRIPPYSVFEMSDNCSQLFECGKEKKQVSRTIFMIPQSRGTPRLPLWRRSGLLSSYLVAGAARAARTAHQALGQTPRRGKFLVTLGWEASCATSAPHFAHTLTHILTAAGSARQSCAEPRDR